MKSVLFDSNSTGSGQVRLGAPMVSVFLEVALHIEIKYSHNKNYTHATDN